MPVPFSGGNISKEKAVFSLLLSGRLLSFLFRYLCPIGKNLAHWEQKYKKEMRNAEIAGYSFIQRMERAL